MLAYLKRVLVYSGFMILCQLANLIATLMLIVGILINAPRARRIVLAYDELFNTASNGQENEYFSDRAYSALLNGRHWGIFMCWLLDFAEKDHCKKSWEKRHPVPTSENVVDLKPEI